MTVRLRLAALATTALALAGCSTTIADLNAKSWIGTPIDELVREVGQPDEVSEDGRYSWYNSYVENIQVGGSRLVPNADGSYTQVNDYGFEDVRRTCELRYRTDARGIIVNAQAIGDCGD